MERRFIIALLITITLALAGLVAIQVYWIRDTIALKDMQFGQSVDNALIAVSDRLEHIEALNGIRGHEKGRRIFSRLDSLDRFREEEHDGSDHPLRDHLNIDGNDQALSEGHAWMHDSIDLAVNDDRLSDEDREALIADMVRGILGAEMFRSIGQRVDPFLLDSLITYELGSRGISAEHQQGVLDEAGLVSRASLLSGTDTVALRTSVHRVRLFHNDLVGMPYFLHVVIPHQDRMVIRAMTPLLVIAGSFVLIIVLAFAYTIHTIWRQKRISDIKNDLVNNLTHELKTPISTIALACEALNDPSIPQSPEQLRMFTGMIRDENKRLGVLVESVLQSAVLDSGRMRIKPVDLDLHALLHDVVRSAGIQASRRGGTIQLDERAELAHVSGDRIHLTNVFYNLMDNALKYTQAEPRVLVRTSSDARGVTVSISDNGIGIPASEQKKIFDRLYRVPTGNIHNVKGFGLGLSYVKAVVENHHGSIRVESEPGNGSTFHITLPFEHGLHHTDIAR